MVVMSKSSPDPSVHETGGYTVDDKFDQNYFIRKLIQRFYIDASRTNLSNTLFSFSYPGIDITSTSFIQSADIINLHWVGWFQTPATIHKLFNLGKPVVWTLHDMNPLTGGCHYSAGCDCYIRECQDCPQLSSDPHSLPNAILKDKLELFEGYPLTIVTPSHWLANCARKSSLFKSCRIEVIPNCIETDIFAATSKDEAKTALGIDPQNIVLMFGADTSNEKRKGFAELEAAIAMMRDSPPIEDMISHNRITILTLGPLTADISKLGLHNKAMGTVNDDALIARAYSAADIFVLPSLEDNLPNMMLESMACGTPVLAFDTGGIHDVVVDGMNGRLVPTGDVVAMAHGLIELVMDRSLRERLGAASTALVHGEYSPKIQAGRYIALFEDLLNTSARAPRTMNNTGSFGKEFDQVKMECGPVFDTIRHKVMFHAFLRAMPEIYQSVIEKRDSTKEEMIHKLVGEVDSLRNSFSWRLTAPLRKLQDLFRKA
ncbi:putative glycosyltransferase YpjH [Geobacter sp. OR-1]|nr:putative glycosyltransferase YpjH [Geobacter sp. OR-1]